MNEQSNTFDRAAEFSVFLGILMLFAGLFSIVTPHVYAPFFDHYIGWMFLMIGVIQFFHGYASQQGWSLVLLMTIATFNVFMGGMLLNNPYTDILGLVLPIALLLASEGIGKILLSFAFSGRAGWTWFLISGLMSCFMASLVYAGLPTTSFWMLGLLFGVNFLTTGFASFFSTLMQQRQSHQTSSDETDAAEELAHDPFDQVEEELGLKEEQRWPEPSAA